MTPRYRNPLNRGYVYWEITSKALISTKFVYLTVAIMNLVNNHQMFWIK